ncbi:MAG TPA: 30S ribosomal protein S20 [Candidatus Paceibacterota bacterium]|nr:30S ribosomal protein S20 [Candidatus Paceibacterota bacterium]
MPITKSAHKALRKSKRLYAVNQKKKMELKAALKSFQKLVEQNKLKDAKAQLKIVYQRLDKAAKTNLIKKNKASRLKSRLTAQLNKKSK